MAANGELKAHEQTYNGFTRILKWTTIIAFLVAAGVVWLIAG